jgi:hypothetical protein
MMTMKNRYLDFMKQNSLELLGMFVVLVVSQPFGSFGYQYAAFPQLFAACWIVMITLLEVAMAADLDFWALKREQL